MSQDLNAGFDPTGDLTITAANLLELVNAATPYVDVGFVRVTQDIAGNPQVPDAVGDPKLVRYLWKRELATSVTVYIWSATVANDPTYLKWVPIASGAIADGSITGSKIANLTITDANIASVGWGKITGIPTSFTPGGAAGGDLTGTYPNPTVGANKIDGSKLLSDATVDANRAVSTNHIKNQNVLVASKLDVGAALSFLRTKSDLTGAEWAIKLILQAAEPTVTEELKILRVKADASGFEYVTQSAIVNAGNAAITTTFASTLVPMTTAAGVMINVAHGLSTTPRVLNGVLVNTTGEFGYSIGDEAQIFGLQNSAGNNNFVLGCNATNVWVIASQNDPFIRKLTDASSTQITKANWSLRVYARI